MSKLQLIMLECKIQNLKFTIALVPLLFEGDLYQGANVIDVSFFASGIYTIRVIGNDSVYQQKLVKE
jgi:hypothetical protein